MLLTYLLRTRINSTAVTSRVSIESCGVAKFRPKIKRSQMI
jgi:hypothetical protein